MGISVKSNKGVIQGHYHIDSCLNDLTDPQRAREGITKKKHSDWAKDSYVSLAVVVVRCIPFPSGSKILGIRRRINVMPEQGSMMLDA